MIHNERQGWQKVRRRAAHKFGVNILAKLWVRSKRLRELRASYLRRSLLPTSRKSRPLREGEIRLLQMKPGNTMSTIECNFSYVDLQSAGEYVALSYTWGQIPPSIPILVHGKVSLISENLYLALLHFRQRGIVTIWVDALCINQEDLDERARQVSQMKDVYRKAAMVLVWLGESNELSERAFDELHGLTEHLDYDEAVPSRFFSRGALNQHSQRWRAISEILYRPWFRRMWVIQEVLSARRAMMVCGKDILDLDLFLKLINSMIKARVLKQIMSYHPSRHELSEGPMRVVLEQLEFLVKAKFEVTNYLMQHKFKPTLLNYLAETRWAEATNPLDKVYGILSLADDARTLGHWHAERENDRRWIPFEVDYNLSKEAVFINATKAILCTTKSLDVLRFAGYESNSATGLPSWVPDWACEKPHSIPDYLSVCSMNEDKEQSWRPPSKSPSEPYNWDPIRNEVTRYCRPYFSLGEANTMAIKGVHFDTIATLSSHAYPQEHNLYSIDPQSNDPAEWLDMMQQHLETLTQWTEDCVQHVTKCSPYPTGQTTWSALWTTLNGNLTPKTNNLMPEGSEALLHDLRNAQSVLAAFKKHYLSNNSDALSEIASAAALSHFEYSLSRLPRVDSTCFSHRFATTRKKYMGLVPPAAMVGDLICVIYGCEMPFILRKCGLERFKLIGNGRFEGVSFDDVVVESSFVLKRGKKKPKKESYVVTCDRKRRKVYTVFKKARLFDLV